ncbi:MAG: winged helix-turn-helix transcriptional regulator [Streptosporangiaceae bacterium]|nr:winged helix-turn-helix transcriptional regulator [Streptosporangiaceae bacterium]
MSAGDQLSHVAAESEDPVLARLAELEARVAQLEQGRGTGPARARPSGPAADDALWVVNGLRGRLPAGTGAVVFAGVVPAPEGGEYLWQYGRTAADLRAADWAERSQTIAALGHPVRMLLAQLVLSGTRSVADLQEDPRLGTSGQLYHHLRQLVAAGWLQQATRGHYEVPAARVVPLLVMLTAAER